MFRLLTTLCLLFTSTWTSTTALKAKREWTQAEIDEHLQMMEKLLKGNDFDVLGGYINHEPYAKMLDVHNRRERIRRARQLKEEEASKKTTSNLRGGRKLGGTISIGDVYDLLEEHIPCNETEVNLEDSPQWAAEKGYWEGELSLYKENGDPSDSPSWPYQYDHYKGFITSAVHGNTYKQRNIFMYPPLGHQPIEELYTNVETTKAATDAAVGWSARRKAWGAYFRARIALWRAKRKNNYLGQNACEARLEDSELNATMVIGNGTCGVNGNTKLFEAEQKPTTCSNNPELAGDIEGPYGSLSYTYTQLVGNNDNALLYQVYLTSSALNWYVFTNSPEYCPAVFIGVNVTNMMECGFTEDRLMQSQLTTLTTEKTFTGQTIQRRTRTAQGFDAFVKVGTPSYSSFYREKKVAEQGSGGDNFYNPDMALVQRMYNIDESDMGTWKSKQTGGVMDSGLVADTGILRVKSHLNQTFEAPVV
jgi:hypothetical protein